MLRITFYYLEYCNTQQIVCAGSRGCRTFYCHHYPVRHVTGIQLLPKQVLRRCDLTLPLSYFTALFSSRPSISCLYLLVFPVTAVFPWITRCNMQYLRNMWSIHVSFLRFTVCSVFISSWIPWNTPLFSHDLSTWHSPSFFSTTFQNFRDISDNFPKCPTFSATQNYASHVAFY